MSNVSSSHNPSLSYSLPPFKEKSPQKESKRLDLREAAHLLIEENNSPVSDTRESFCRLHSWRDLGNVIAFCAPVLVSSVRKAGRASDARLMTSTKTQTCTFKGIVQIMPSFTHPYLVPNPYSLNIKIHIYQNVQTAFSI